MKNLPMRRRGIVIRKTLYLDRQGAEKAAENARIRYGERTSLSALVDALLLRENSVKGGIINAKLKTR